MSYAVKETPCTRCVHREVCKYKKDFLDVIGAVNDAQVTWSEGNRAGMKRVTDFECVAQIDVTCKFYLKDIVQSRELDSVYGQNISNAYDNQIR